MADEWAGYEDAPDDEKLRIAQHFLLSSPPGQVHDVLRDVAKLVPAHVLTDAALRGALHAYNLKNMLAVDVPDADYQILICEEGEVDATHYVDPIGKRIFGFDHVKQQLIADDVEDVPASFKTSFESERLIVQKGLQSYLQFEYMHQGTAGVYVKGTHLIVNLCTKRINLRNFWSGRWQSRWEVNLTENPLRVKGKIALHVHYFENGNLQLKNEKVVEEEVSYSSSMGMSDALLRVIKEAEDNLQTNLEDMYINMSQETFKEMRRVMPGTQTMVEIRRTCLVIIEELTHEYCFFIMHSDPDEDGVDLARAPYSQRPQSQVVDNDDSASSAIGDLRQNDEENRRR